MSSIFLVDFITVIDTLAEDRKCSKQFAALLPMLRPLSRETKYKRIRPLFDSKRIWESGFGERIRHGVRPPWHLTGPTTEMCRKSQRVDIGALFLITLRECIARLWRKTAYQIVNSNKVVVVAMSTHRLQKETVRYATFCYQAR